MYPYLKKDFEWYLEHQDELSKEHEGKYIVIKKKKVLGAYNDEREAIRETNKSHEEGSYIVQLCQKAKDTDVRMYYSRVSF